MKTLEIISHRRTELGKVAAKHLRKKAQLPCVLYGGKAHIHLHAAMAQLKPLVYTPDVFFINLRVEQANYTCILQSLQVHPVSEMLLHADFLQIFDDKPIKMHIPIRLTGDSPGVAKGGLLLKKLRKLQVVALPQNIPSYINVDISSLDLGKTAKVKDLPKHNYTILDQANIPVTTVVIPRALKSQKAQDAKSAK